MVISIEVVSALLIIAFACMFTQALGGVFRLGKLTIQPGWLGLAIWGLLAAHSANPSF